MILRDPRLIWRLSTIGTAFAGILLIFGVVVLAWAGLPAPLPDVSAPEPTTMVPSREREAGKPEIWSRLQIIANVAPPVSNKPKVQREVTILAVMQKRGRTVAAVELAKGAPLAYLAQGDTMDGISITTIEQGVVTFMVDGQSRKTEVRP